MFERYAEKARRVIFFARYEASQYGSPNIETEHLLLGLVREDQPLLKVLLKEEKIGGNVRAEIERHITSQRMISTSVEVPLSNECKKVLNLASDEAQRLGHRHVGTAHLLLGMLGAEGSLAARLLQAKGLNVNAVRQKVAMFEGSVKETRGVVVISSDMDLRGELPKATLQSFLTGLKSLNLDYLMDFFAERAYLIDASGARWDREGIHKNFETLFAPYAKKKAAPVVEATSIGNEDFLVTSVLWKNAILASEQRAWVHRMSVVLIRENVDWRILLMHVTPVVTP
jgi:ATP-dependent Clp protease ATP-binding subunit ClpA